MIRALLRQYCEQADHFAQVALGMKLPAAQKEWTRFFGHKRLFHAAPRDHGKSTLYSFLLPLWEMVRQPQIRILLVSKTLELASRFITHLRTEIESNPRINYLYGSLKPSRPRAWNRYALTLKCDRNMREPTVRALGVLGSCAGLRADLIIADDLIDSEMCFFSKQRERVRQWFFSELTPVLEAGGRMLVVGTRKHHDDLYAHLIQNPAYLHRIDRAILDESRREVLMPERWTYERLLADREEIGTVAFNREKQNQVVDETTALFKWEWLEGCLEPSLVLGTLPTAGVMMVQGIDLASVADPHHALEKDTDFSVVCTLAALEDDRYQLVDLWMDRGLTPYRLMECLREQINRYQPALVVVENNAFQGWVEQELRGTTTSVVMGHTTTHGKKRSLEEGIPSLAVLFERRKILLPCGDEGSRVVCQRLIDQLSGLGWEAHDDLVMALWFAMQGIRQIEDQYQPGLKLKKQVLRF